MNYKKIKYANRDEHVLIMEKYLGRPLEKGEIVHHIDEDKSHNGIDNLELCLKSVHSRYHMKKIQSKRPQPKIKHGTLHAYKRYKCRCNDCKLVKSNENKIYNPRRIR